jgi:hypothetical protein
LGGLDNDTLKVSFRLLTGVVGIHFGDIACHIYPSHPTGLEGTNMFKIKPKMVSVTGKYISKVVSGFVSAT